MSCSIKSSKTYSPKDGNINYKRKQKEVLCKILPRMILIPKNITLASTSSHSTSRGPKEKIHLTPQRSTPIHALWNSICKRKLYIEGT